MLCVCSIIKTPIDNIIIVVMLIDAYMGVISRYFIVYTSMCMNFIFYSRNTWRLR